MRKIIAVMNISVDGYCDHTIGTPDEELHDHYADLLRGAGAVLYGRKTFQLMEFWKSLVEKPSGDKSMDEFAKVMDEVPKIVFSRTLKETGWYSATLATKSLQEEVFDLKQQEGKDIFAGSPGMIDSLTQLNLVDEYQLCVHPVIAGSGLALFKNLKEPINLQLFHTKRFTSGTIILYYKPAHRQVER